MASPHTIKKMIACTSLSLLAGFASIFVASAGTTAALDNCWTMNQTPGTGCVSATGCNWISPNKGINWNEVEQCCYDPATHILTGDSFTGCASSFNQGCCNNIDTASHCKIGQCPPYSS
jgi:hypothetical protein